MTILHARHRIPFMLTASLIYDVLDLVIQLDELPSEWSFIALDTPLEIAARRSPLSDRIPYLLTAILLGLCAVVWFIGCFRHNRTGE